MRNDEQLAVYTQLTWQAKRNVDSVGEMNNTCTTGLSVIIGTTQKTVCTSLQKTNYTVQCVGANFRQISVSFQLAYLKN